MGATENEDGTVVLDKIPDHTTHYVLTVTSDDWHTLIHYMIKDEEKRGGEYEADEAFLRADTAGGVTATYYLKKTRFSPKVIGKLLGVEPERATEAKTIQLGKLGDQSQWQQATVPYRGRA